tara:strand:- start:12190 stop:12939 length:750 start_codon:yes stop_codon:yes gene_type:complete
MNLLSTGNPKVLKGLAQGYNTYILHLAPADLSGYETCAKRTTGCTAACLNLAGRGGMFKRGETTNVIQQARIRKTKMFFEDRITFMNLLVKDIELGIKQSKRLGLIPVFRLNGTSDLAFEKYEVNRNGQTYSNIFRAFPEVTFYDYTKILGRKISNLANYSLTFSAADGNDVDVYRAITQGYNVATVFGLKKTEPMPETYLGRPVFNGDESDLRFLDPKGVVVGLYAKGKAKKDTTGFVKYPVLMMKAA